MNERWFVCATAQLGKGGKAQRQSVGSLADKVLKRCSDDQIARSVRCVRNHPNEIGIVAGGTMPLEHRSEVDHPDQLPVLECPIGPSQGSHLFVCGEISHKKSEVPIISSTLAPLVADSLDIVPSLFRIDRVYGHVGISGRIEPPADVRLLAALGGPDLAIQPKFHTHLDDIVMKQVS